MMSFPNLVIVIIISSCFVPFSFSRAKQIPLLHGLDQLNKEDFDAFQANRQSQTMKTSDPDAYIISWNLNGKTKNLVIEVVAKTTGYVGFGFSPNSMMENADIIIGGVDPSGIPYYDGYIGKDHLPNPVSEAEGRKWMIIEANETNDQTRIIFSRSYDGGLMPVDLKEGGTNIIWSIGETDDIPKHHKDRGSDVIDFMFIPKNDPPPPAQQDEPSDEPIDKTNQPRSINETTTTPPPTTPKPKTNSAESLFSSLTLFYTILLIVNNF